MVNHGVEADDPPSDTLQEGHNSLMLHHCDYVIRLTPSLHGGIL